MKGHYETLDFWARKAAKEGYPARSVYKLEEITRKFQIVKRGMNVLDLGAAPGSWTVFLLRNFEGVRVTSCDLNPLSAKISLDCYKERLFFVLGDLNNQSIYDRISKRSPFDLVASDAAPLTTGNRTVDTERSGELVKMAMNYAFEMLKTGGNFIAKVFQNGSEKKFLSELKERFNDAKCYKPVACRANSFEVYLLGLEKK